ncbi:MAG TPA: glycogen-binding domain-containing protein [Gemmatimonadaceae bacterium]
MPDPSTRDGGARRRVPLGAALAALFTFAASLVASRPAPLAAQSVVGSLDAGEVGVRYGDSATISSLALTPALRVELPRATLNASGTYSVSGSGDWSAQGALSASLFTGRLGPLRPEIAGDAGGSTHADGVRTGQLSATLRLHLMRGTWGAWAGGGGGGAWDGEASHQLAIGDVGAWARWRAATFVATATPTHVSGGGDYTDAQLSVRWVNDRVELGGSLGARAGRALALGDGGRRAWGSGSATLWFGEHLALVGAAGSYPVDLAQGFPGGRYATLALRLASRRPHPGAAARRGDARRGVDGGASAAGVDRFALADASGGGRERVVRVHAPRAARVEVAGDFTDWRPVALAPAGHGWWTATLPIAPGTHQVNLRLDGSRWVAPPGLTVITDEFGGSFGLLTVSASPAPAM